LGTVSFLQPASLILLAFGFGGLTLLSLIRPRRYFMDVNPWGVIALSLLVAVMQGGIITDGVRSATSGEQNVTTAFGLRPFTLPSCPTGQLGLSCGVLSLANMGLIPFLLPSFAVLTFQGRKDNAQIVLVLGAIAAYGLSMVLSYGYDQWNLLRVISFTTWVLVVFMTPWFYQHLTAGGTRRWITVVFLIISTYSGVITLWMMIDGRWVNDAVSIDFSPLVPPNDLAMMKIARRLPLDALVFDSLPCTSNTSSRPGYVLGRYTRISKSRSEWQTRPEGFDALLKRPSADAMRQAGYTHLYVDQDWYYGLDPEGQDALKHGNYEVIAATGDETDFRLLLRVCSEAEECQPNPDAFPQHSSPSPTETETSSP
jgi:hypothetical protein